MENIRWNTDLEIGIDVIDAQHKRLVDYINDLNKAISHGHTETVYQVMEQLRDYTMDHFAFEEELLEQAGYPLTDSHKQVHRRFEAKVEIMVSELGNGTDPMGVARRARNTMMVWLIQHIRHEDQDYAPFVKKILNKNESWVNAALKRVFGTTRA
ncbi:MAG: hypothetical protein CMI02_08310 [Oceanospirillaceae bacterium]|nr:hypothetical protein [Oceanospirillaceae bacterium]MBT12024.1 hypothetical protein [Oceanospirillaceae bacterium]|tara:strand:- start:98257 stop:98721 length:465 start_codon:yes stop_codon:yes gene_type:complete